MYINEPSKIIIKKDFFIQSRSENIHDYYKFEAKPLGRGAYGIAYLAHMTQSPYSVRVVKQINKRFVKNPSTLTNEIQLLKQIDSPSIVKLYEIFEDSKNVYLVQDYCEGGQLFDRLEQHGNLSENDARFIFKQMVKLIIYLHTHHIAHRDLKPQNFLMRNKKSFQIKLIDFGLAFKWKNNMRKQLIEMNKNKIIGTSYYIAPEILNLNYDQKCDIWSLGVLLYILVTAAPPFDGQDDKQIMKSIKKLNYSLQIPEAKHLSLEVKDLIRKILVPDDERLTLQEIMQHQWMVKQTIKNIPLKLNFNKIKSFVQFSKFKTIVMTYIASQVPQKQIQQLGLLFKQIDKNSDGFLTMQQLKQALEDQNQNTNYIELTKLMQHIDTDKNGVINYNQFVACCLQGSSAQTEKYLQWAFKNFDRDNSGKISKKQFKQILEQSSIQILNQKVLDDLIKDCDQDHDGEISYQQFLHTMGIMSNIK